MTTTHHSRTGRWRPSRAAVRPSVAAGAAALAVGALVAAAPTTAAGPAAQDRTHRPAGASGAVVLDWNRVMLRTFGEGPVPVPVQGFYGGYVGAAVANAVLTIEGGYAPYLPQDAAARGASVEAAVSTAAYEVLSELVPASEPKLAADRDRWLATVADPAARAAGTEVGEDAAEVVLAARTGDGRGAPVTLTTTPGPGVWDVPATGMLAPWLGFARPFSVPNQTWLRLSGPDPLTSRRYAADLAEVKAMGAKTGSSRSAAQTETALFWNANVVAQYNTALADRLGRHRAGARDAARAFGLLNVATADALVTCWRQKYDVHNWRPQQAIQRADTDGNPATTADPAWQPLVANPPYPDYASGHACVSGAFTETLANLYGRDRIDVDVSSSVTGTTRHYDRASTLNRETKDARVWLGIHFRKAMDDGNRIGRASADHVGSHAFLPVRR